MDRQGTHGTARRRWTWLLPALCLAGCSAPSGLTINPVVIHRTEPERDGNRAALHRYYETVFARMRDALRGGTRDSLSELRYLVQQHKRDGMVAFAFERIEQFELLADGLEFELALPELCTIEHLTARPTAHEKQSFRFRMRGPADGRELSVGGDGEDALAFQVIVSMRDFDATGQVLEASHNLALAVTDEHDLTGGASLTIPFEVPGARAQTAVRELSMAVEVLPGVVRLDGRRLPVSQIGRRRLTRLEVEKLPAVDRLTRGTAGYRRCCTFSTLLYPEGHAAIEKAPLKTLRVAKRRGDAKYFRHVFLATHFMPARDREAAMALLIGWVRNGTPAQARVAMGSLRVLSRVDRPVTDREAWLLWWQSRQSK